MIILFVIYIISNYYFDFQIYEWVLDVMKYVVSMKMEYCEILNGLDKLLRSLDLYLRDYLVMKLEIFICMFDLVEKFQSDKLLEQCRVVKERCDEI